MLNDWSAIGRTAKIKYQKETSIGFDSDWIIQCRIKMSYIYAQYISIAIKWKIMPVLHWNVENEPILVANSLFTLLQTTIRIEEEKKEQTEEKRNTFRPINYNQQ